MLLTHRHARLCVYRLLLPLPYMTFGDRVDRQLLTLTTSSQRLVAASDDSSHSVLVHDCLQALRQRVKLSWESDEGVRGEAKRRGQLVPALSLTVTQLAQLLAPPVVFNCECENRQSEMTDSQQLDNDKATSAPPAAYRSSSAGLYALSSPSSFSSTSFPHTFPQPSLVRNVSNVLMADKLVRSLSNPSSPLAHSLPITDVSPGSMLPSLVGFGPHRVPVGSFIRVSVDVRNSNNVLGTLTLQLHISQEDGSGGQQQQQQPVVLTAGYLSPLLPSIAAGDSVRHEWSVCCLAKGQFAFRISARTHTSPLSHAAVDKQESMASFARLHASLSTVRAVGTQQIGSQQPLSVRTPSEAKHEADHSAATHFVCPQLLLLDAYV